MAFSKQIIDKNRQAWIARLIDTTRRNNLLYFSPEKTDKVFDISLLGTSALGTLMGLGAISPSSLLKDEVSKKKLATLKQIHKRSRINEEERSIQTLFIARGLFRWPAEDGGRAFCAPALLLPIEMKSEEGSRNQFRFQLSGDVETNRPLLVYWKQQLGIDTDAIELLFEELDPDATGDGWSKCVEKLIGFLKEKSIALPGVTFEDGAWLSNFSFQKIGLVQDLESLKEQSYVHPIVATLCGDADARKSLESNQPDFTADQIDSVSAEDDFTFLPCDSSQFTVIRNVIGGKSGVIQGPPGTGKSQTIANLIAELVARGKRVLFVAEKKAALDVVYDRLLKAGLSDFILNLHGGDLRGKKLSDQLAKGLQQLSTSAVSAGDHTLSKWEAVRAELVQHGEIFHKVWAPWNISAYDCMNWLMGHPRSASPTLRIQADSLEKISVENKDGLKTLLDEYGRVMERMNSGGVISWGEAIKQPGEKTSSLIDCIQDCIRQIEKIYLWYHNHSFVRKSDVEILMKDIETDLSHLQLLDEARVFFNTTAFNTDIYAEANLLESKKDKPLQRIASRLFSSDYNHATLKARSLFKDQDLSVPEMIPLLKKQIQIRQYWNGNPPSEGADTSGLKDCFTNIALAVQNIAEYIPAVSTIEHLKKLQEVLERLVKQQDQAYLIPKMIELQSSLENTGLMTLVKQCQADQIPSSDWSSVFEHLFYRSILSIMKAKDMRIAAFDGKHQDEKRMLFRELDKKRMNLAVARIKRRHAERMTELLNRYPDQENTLRAQSRRKHPWPFKKIYRSSSDVLLSVFPCWMASPLTVTQFMGGEQTPFDVVLFDEASQVQPEDAVSSILRGKQLVVSGDTRQLPPTRFFADGSNEDDSGLNEGQELSSTGFESLLHLVLGNLPGLGPAGDGWFLEWHYRSRDESLIAFSNEHIYNGRMVTFPRPNTLQAVHFIQVIPPDQTDVGQESVSSEVLRVTELALKMASEFPEKSLGIIALGIEHARRIEEAIDSALEGKDAGIQSFFSENRKEPFFVKNLERVQGDERDIVILSIGYGQNRHGTLSHNFGPINQDGGERRLNVAITRSREQMWVVASFDPMELNPERTKGLGPALLRKYLIYAQSGGRNLGQERPSGTEENFFERDIREALEAKGLQITPQYGVSGYRIDLVVHHPERPGEFVMAIECDGASYHSSPCARDRDRLRQEFLEGMGWNFHRIWSTDWFTRKDEEVERALHSYRVFVSESKLKISNTKSQEKELATQSELPPMVQGKGPRPPVPVYDSISDYSDRELFLLAQWILSDGQLRSDQMLFEELFSELGFKRKGNAITARLNDIIRRMKS